MNGRRQFPWWGWLLVIAQVTITVIYLFTALGLWKPIGQFTVNVIRVSLDWFDNPESMKYLLGAIAQVLGAVFAIVFSITPIVTQPLGRYITRPLRFVFTRGIFIYIIGFAITITLPLWFLGSPNALLSFIAVILGSLFVWSLIWYFSYIIRRSNIVNLIPVFYRRSLSAISRDREEEALNMISSLEGIAIRALEYREFEVFFQAEGALVTLLLDIERRFWGRDE